jgi:hypothetical protein
VRLRGGAVELPSSTTLGVPAIDLLWEIDPERDRIKTWLVQAIEHYAHASWFSPNNVAVLAEATVSQQQGNLVRNWNGARDVQGSSKWRNIPNPTAFTAPPTNAMVPVLLTLCRGISRRSIIVRACAENLKAG